MTIDDAKKSVPSPEVRVVVEEVADCPFSLSLDFTPAIFPMLESPVDGVRLPIAFLPAPFSPVLSRSVNVRFQRQRDRTEPGRAHDEFDFDWNARSHWLPNFHGVLRLRADSLKTRIIMTGFYVPPFGRLGGIFDRYVGHNLADASAHDMVSRLARSLEEHWAAERRASLVV